MLSSNRGHAGHCYDMDTRSKRLAQPTPLESVNRHVPSGPATLVESGNQTAGGPRLVATQSRLVLSGVPAKLSATVPSDSGVMLEIEGGNCTVSVATSLVMLPPAEVTTAV